MNAKDYIKQQFGNYMHLVSGTKAVLKRFNLAEIKETYTEIVYKLSNLSRTNYELGLYHFKLNHFSDAIFRFKIAKRLNATYIEADYYIALCYYDEFQYEKAKSHLMNYLSLDNIANMEAAKFLLNVVNGTTSDLNYIPASIIAHKFEQIITQYGSSVLAEIPFEPQKQLFSMIAQYLQTNHSTIITALDLGCGIGTMTKLARKAKLASLVYGVDLSPHMVEIAKSEKVDEIPLYNTVINEEALSYMQRIVQSGERKFDVIIASDLVCYTAKLEELFSLSKQLLNDKGAIAITFRLATGESKTSVFDPYVQQFSFSLDYISSAASQHGFSISAQQETPLINGDAGMSLVLAAS